MEDGSLARPAGEDAQPPLRGVQQMRFAEKPGLSTQLPACTTEPSRFDIIPCPFDTLSHSDQKSQSAREV
jgi:hypothetical protein